MQLAATHRPHPPPVPPRPSRQVVADALKRTPRPPCPTRQAPPPPNTKPWRPGDKSPSAGRTVIYESKIKKDQLIKCNERTIDPKKTQECRGRSERTENHRERQQQQLVKQPTEFIINGNEKFADFTAITAKKESQGNTLDVINRKDVVTTALRVSRVQGTENPTDYEANKQVKVCGDVDTIKDSVEEVKGAVTGKRDSSLSISSTEIKTKKVQVTKNENCDNIIVVDKLSHVQVKTKISTDDCSTVVVIDEPEHKIIINEDNKDNKDNIQHQDWLEAGVRYSSTKITLPGDDTINDCVDGYEIEGDENVDDNENDERMKFNLDLSSIRERIAMSSLQGLPPLPRSLSGFNLSEVRRDNDPPPPPARSSSKTLKGGKTPQQSGSRPSPPSRQLTTLDTQLAILRKEMFGLRQLDLSLLSQLWSLNESIQEFRQLLQEQEDRAPSSSPSSEDGEEVGYHGHPPPPPRRPAPLLHHHRPPRPPRPLRPPPSDESPSSEEYGAV